jgi:sigma-B regulation protein RsbU (phosphoserine phosphatase)
MAADETPASYRYQEALEPLARGIEDPKLKKKLSEVLALLDFNSTLNRSLELSEIVDLVLFVAMGETRASWAGVLLREDGGPLTPCARRGRSDDKWSTLELSAPSSAQPIAGVGDENVSEWARVVLTSAGAALMVPLVKAERLVGLLLLGDRGEPYGADERLFAETLCVSAAAAIDNGRVYEELQRLNQRLSLKVYQLDSLFDIARELNRSPDISRVREVLLTNAMGHVLTTRALMLHSGRIVEQRGCTLSPEDRVRIEAGGQRLAELADDVRVADLPDGEVRDILLREGIDTAIPLRSGESCHGALLLGPRGSGKSLVDEDRDFLRSLASQAAASLDNLRLTREFVEKQKIEKEMAIARRIQRALLPESEPGIQGWDIAGINIPCLTVGGDYFDYVDRGDDKHWLVIADVSGKGTGAALLMASVQAAVHALAGIGDISLESLTERLNEIVYTSTEGNRYVTAFFATVDALTGETVFVNAGHCFPVVLRRDGSVERLEEGGPVIGLLPEVSIKTGRTRLNSGDLLVLYTDGLSETSSPEGEEFEEERIVEIMRESEGKPSREIMATLLSRVRVFAADAGLSDDLTLMVVQRN